MSERFVKRNKKMLACLLALLMIVSIIPLNMLSVKADENSSVTEPTITAIWDVDGEAKDFSEITEADPVELNYNSSHVSENKKIRFIANYPSGATDLKFTIDLGVGLVWADTGVESITVLESSEGPVGADNIYSSKMGNGTMTYELKQGTTAATIEIMVRRSVSVDMPMIIDGLKATASCELDGEVLESDVSLKAVKLQQYAYSSVTNNTGANYNIQVKPGEQGSANGPIANVVNYVAGMPVNRLLSSAKFTVVANKDLEYVSTKATSGGNATISTGGFELVSKEELDADNYVYVFEIRNLYKNIFGICPVWKIPEDAEIGTVYQATVSKIEWSYYGDTEAYVYEPASEGKTNYTKYTVVDPNERNEVVTVEKNYSWTITDYKDDQPIVEWIGGLAINNTGVDPSLPKVIEFEFDEKIGVTTIPIRLPNGKKLTKINYKLPGDTEWREADVNLTGNSEHQVILTTLKAGLEEGQYFAAIKYELDFVGTFDGEELHYGIPAQTRVNGGANYNAILGYNIGLNAANPKAVSTIKVYDLVPEGETPAHSDSATFTTLFDSTTYRNNMNINNSEQLSAKSGEKLNFTYKIIGTNRDRSESKNVQANLFPIIYVRDETGLGITDVTLTNADGVDILAKHGIDVVLDHEEEANAFGYKAKVYKIDTTTLEGLTEAAGRYDATVGPYDVARTNKYLTLKYNVSIPSDYNDNQTIHYMANAIALGDRGMTFTNTQAGSGIALGDRLDMDGDGSTTDKDVVTPVLNYSHINGTYTIIGKDDISVTFSAKRESSAEYETYSDGKYIQVEAGETYNVKTTIRNNSGVATGTAANQISYVFIPIPKDTQDWGGSNSGVDEFGNASDGFKFSMNLKDPIVNPDPEKFEISYAYVDPGTKYEGKIGYVTGEMLKADTSISWGEFSPSANMVMVAAKGLAAETSYDIVMNLTVDASAKNQQINVYNAMFYENLTTQDDKVFQGMYVSDLVGFKVVWGSISGIVFEDLNGNGKKDANESGIPDFEVMLLNLGTTEYPVSAYTDENGAYKFDQVPIGKFNVIFFDFDEENTLATVAPEEGLYYDVELPTIDVDGKTNYELTGYSLGIVPKHDIEYSVTGEVPNSFVLPTTDKVFGGETYTAKTVNEVAGYTFDGWYTDEAMKKPYKDGTLIASKVTLYGKWTQNKYNVTFNYTDDSEVPNNDGKPEGGSDYVYDSSVELPTLSKNGYIFDGWYTNEDLDGTKYTGTYTVTDDVDFYAKWTIDTQMISGKVRWYETGEKYVRPQSIVVEVLQNGTPVNEIELNVHSTLQQFGIGHLPIADADGVDYVYTVRQKVNPAGYKTTVNDSTYEIINTYTCHTFTFEKEWDTTGAPTAHPDSVLIYLNKDGSEFEEFVLNEGNNWTASYEIADVDYENHTFAAQELTVPGYKSEITKSENGTNITYTFANSFVMPLVTVSGKVSWENIPSFYVVPGVVVTLVKDGVATSKTFTVTPSMWQAAGADEYEFANLPRYNADGSEIVYTVSIPESVDYETSYSNANVDSDGNAEINILNTCNTKTIEVIKSWDTTGAPSAHPDSVEIDVMRSDSVDPFTTIILNANDADQVGNYRTSFDIIESQYDGFTFELVESGVEGYEATYIDPVVTSDGVSLEVKNTYVMPQIVVSGTKTWVGNPDGYDLPNVELNLMLGDVIIETITLPGGEADFSFSKVDRYNDDGEVNDYTIVEGISDDFIIVYSYETDDDGNIKATLVNTCNVNSLTFEKVWDTTGAPSEHPESVTIKILRDGDEYMSVVLDESNDWTETIELIWSEFSGYTFTVEEEELDEYEASYECDTEDENLIYTITNKYIMPEITVEGDIEWKEVPEDFDGKDVTVVLKLDGEEIDKVTVKAGEDGFKFEGLDRYDSEGKVNEYEVEISPIENFDISAEKTVAEDGTISYAVTFTNTLKPEPEPTPTPEPAPGKDPETGDNMNVLIYLALMLGCVLVMLGLRKAEDK